MAEQWEYKIFRVSLSFHLPAPSGEPAEPALNELGAAGWELVTALAIPAWGGPVLLFKRRVE